MAAAVAKLPEGWAALCLAREDAVERLANLALRLQSYTRSAGTPIPRSVRGRVAEELGVLRHATLELVEAVVRWQAEVRPCHPLHPPAPLIPSPTRPRQT